MTSKKRYMLLIGMFSLSLGICWGFFIKPASLVSIFGLVIGSGCLILFAYRSRGPLKKRADLKGERLPVYYFIQAVFLLAALTAVNVLAAKLSLRMDLTAGRQHTLSNDTIRIIKNLKQDVQVVAFYVGIPPQYLKDLLLEYQRISNQKIQAEIIDPLIQIGYAAQFGNVISGKEKKIIVQSGKERQDIDFTEAVLTEKMLTNAVIKATRPERMIYFLTGHGENNIEDETETGYSQFAKILQGNNAVIKKLMLGVSNSIPEDCDLLVIAGAKNPLTKTEEQMVQEYLEQGGEALFLIESLPIALPESPLSEEEKRKNPAFNSILNRWGMRIGEDIVVDMENHVTGDVGCPVTKNYPPHKEIVDNLDYTFFIRPRSIKLNQSLNFAVKVAPLVLTESKERSWGETDRTLNVKFDELFDTPGPVIIAAVAWQPKSDQQSSDTKLAVLTDADFLINNFISQYSNAQLGVNLVNWLTELDEIASIDESIVKVTRLNLSSRQKKEVAMALVLIPVWIAAAGTAVWLSFKD